MLLRSRFSRLSSITPVALLLAAFVFVFSASGQDAEHGRKYKPMPATAKITVTVLKGFNQKPLMNAAVIFHATRDGRNDGNLEVKTDEEGRAVIDVIEIGSKVNVQVIANGFATSAQEISVNTPSQELTVKLLRPRAQISNYQENDGQASQVKPGVQEPPKAAVKPKTVVPVETPPAQTPPQQ
jgi:hypothetical protein